MKKTAIIIGAGPAGLTCAYELLKNSDIQPVIIEKNSFVGGISRTVNHNGNRIDIGGHRFFSKSTQVMDLWQQLIPVQGKDSIDDLMLNRHKPVYEGGPNPEKEKALLIRTRVSRILYLRKFFDYPISLKMQTLANLGFKNTLVAGFSYLVSQVSKRKEVTLEDFMINRFGKVLYQMFFKDYTYKVWGRYPNEISADWGAQRIKGVSLAKALWHMLAKPFQGKGVGQKKVETSLIEQFYYPKHGPGQLWETMAEAVVQGGGDIRYKSCVTDIETKGDRIVSVTVETEGKKQTLSADYVFSSMPIKDLVAALDAEVPKDVENTAKQLPYRDFITVGLLVNKLKIKNTSGIQTVGDRVPDCWIYVQEPDVKMGRVQIFNNWSPYMVKDFKDTVWIGLEYFCQEGDDMWKASDKDFMAFAEDEAVKIGLIEAGSVLDSVRINVEKAYPAYFGTYKDFDKIKNYLDGFANLFCIGRNGQHRYNNMDHSMLTAIEAATIAASGSTDKTRLWQINAEAEYHETQKKERDGEA
ncbi:MAG: NAD(P)/FAD-dependent oxidoreductase [Eubacteriales bacterium]